MATDDAMNDDQSLTCNDKMQVTVDDVKINEADKASGANDSNQENKPSGLNDVTHLNNQTNHIDISDNISDVTDCHFSRQCCINLENEPVVTSTLPEPNTTCNDDISGRVKVMLERLGLTDAHFKHQQRGDPDLTSEDKINIARTLYSQHPVKFLSQFGKYLTKDDVQCFQHVCSNPTVDLYLCEVGTYSKERTARLVRNRRYQAMMIKTAEGSYFSDDEMKYRAPLLYEQMIGQYSQDKTDKEIDKSDHRFSTILLDFMDNCDDKSLYERQKENEEMQEEEEDEDDDDDDKDKKQTATNPSSSPAVEEINQEEKLMLREELVHIMKERFLDGQDADFNYRTVDENAEYDPLDIRDQDEQEKYFDDMEPELVSDVDLDSDGDCWTKPNISDIT